MHVGGVWHFQGGWDRSIVVGIGHARARNAGFRILVTLAYRLEIRRRHVAIWGVDFVPLPSPKDLEPKGGDGALTPKRVGPVAKKQHKPFGRNSWYDVTNMLVHLPHADGDREAK